MYSIIGCMRLCGDQNRQCPDPLSRWHLVSGGIWCLGHDVLYEPESAVWSTKAGELFAVIQTLDSLTVTNWGLLGQLCPSFTRLKQSRRAWMVDYLDRDMEIWFAGLEASSA